MKSCAAIAGLLLFAQGAAAAQEGAPEDARVRFELDARLRYEFYDRAAFGRGPQDDDGYVLWRIAPSVSAQLTPDLRFEGQLFAADIEGRTGGARAADRNEFDLTQAYVDWTLGDERAVQLRFGRQEIALGSGRLLAANDGANVRRRFDGLLATYRRADWTAFGVTSGLVDVRPGVFDDTSTLDRAMTGGGVVRNLGQPNLEALYAIHARRPEALFGSPRGAQERYTIGARILRGDARGQVEVEAIAQGGEAAGLDVSAWALGADADRRFAIGGFTGEASVRIAIASGDGDPNDDTLGGFDPLFPNPVYAGSIPLLAPTNVIAFNPGVAVMRDGARIGLDVALLRRTSEDDAVYAFSGARAGPARGAAESIGALWSLTLAQPLREGVTLQATASRFEADAYFGAEKADATALFVNLLFTTRRK